MDHSNGLEDRLRGMILENAAAVNGQTRLPQASYPMPQGFPALQQFNTPSNSYGNHPMDASNRAENIIPLSSDGPKKKLNQAQRRQMSSHLSIPIDPRPQPQGMNSAGRRAPQSNRNMQYPSQQYQNNHQQYQSNQGVGGWDNSNQRLSPAYPMPSPLSPFNPQMQSTNFQGRSPTFPVQYAHSPNQQGFVQDPRNRSNGQFAPRSQPQHRQLYNPGAAGGNRGPNLNPFSESAIQAQSDYLQVLVDDHVGKIAIDPGEIAEKEKFRVILENACREAITKHELGLGHVHFNASTVQLKCFGSMASGFATKSSDMDLALLTPFSDPKPESLDSGIPRLLEKTLLDLGYGTRLITRTRVPIIKVCERPTNNLMFDLQRERRNFENSLLQENSEVHVQEQVKATEQPAEISPPPEEHSHDAELISLIQKENETLSEHYASAKRVLFKLGGQDVGLSASTPVDLPMKNLRILNDVSRAFVLGISDADLKQALFAINSTSFGLQEPIPVSLSGVYCQAEIERLAKRWPSRPILEKNDDREETAYKVIMQWVQLVWQAPTNPHAQNKNLYLLLDQVKRIPSLQLATLNQLSHETPVAYYQRMLRLLERPELPANILPMVFKLYIDGVSVPLIQKRLFVLNQGPGKERMGLNALVFHHSLMQLAIDYQRALSTDVYDEADSNDVEAYISLLRGSENLNWADTEKYFNSLTQSSDAAELTARVKQLPNPTDRRNKPPNDRYYDHLSFPDDDSVGIQCDINFSADLGLHNTHLLRCYAAADPRVRPLVLFVKSWASRRKINTPYRGTLSSYGYVLMVLHYLCNVATPNILPNLQLLRRPPPAHLTEEENLQWGMCNGHDVSFWGDEQEIANLARNNQLNQNRDSPGKLLRGFFEYYADNRNYRGFDWGRAVLSLRVQGGIVTKSDKGWTGARTEIDHANKEVKHRYLFAIEDPFEIDHNIGRTVNHDGIVKIRDEFRRAWNLIKETPNGKARSDLLEPVAVVDKNAGDAKQGYKKLMDEVLECGMSGYVARGGTVAGYMAMDNDAESGHVRGGLAELGVRFTSTQI